MQIDQEKLLARVHTALETIKKGGMVIMVDDEDRENEGDLVLAAECVNPQHINFMAKEARGLICLTLEPHIVDRLKLPMMADTTKRLPYQGTAFTVSIEAREGVSTGISAADRAHTIKVAIDPASTPEDIVVPGHIFPLKARAGGVLERAGHTEGSVDIERRWHHGTHERSRAVCNQA
jgi:3,4-dihydroxy 2-butanone 4-phosphate synthase/GTP cyclohydrolase II